MALPLFYAFRSARNNFGLHGTQKRNEMGFVPFHLSQNHSSPGMLSDRKRHTSVLAVLSRMWRRLYCPFMRNRCWKFYACAAERHITRINRVHCAANKQRRMLRACRFCIEKPIAQMSFRVVFLEELLEAPLTTKMIMMNALKIIMLQYANRCKLQSADYHHNFPVETIHYSVLFMLNWEIVSD